MRVLGTSLAAISMVLSGCSGMGPRPVLTRTGVVDREVRQGILSSGPIYNFVQAELAARPYATVTSTGGNVTAANRQATDPQKIRDMLDTGFAAIYASCDDFFRSSGRDQTRLLVIRDIIVALTSLASGALALVDGANEMGGQGNERALAGIALGSTATLSGIDIYTQRFLFGAENIDAVRELTMNALETHRNGVLFPTAAGATAPTSYDRVLIHLMDNQAKCSPRAIARLSRDAIAAGRLQAFTQPGSVFGDQQLTRDEEVRADLGRILDLGGPLTEAQIGALWWLLVADGTLVPTADEIKTVIKPMLAQIPDARNPVASDGKRKDPFALNATITQVLGRLSDPARGALRRQIEIARGEAHSGAPPGLAAAAVPGAAPAAAPRFSLGGPARSSADQRVTVGVAPRN